MSRYIDIEPYEKDGWYLQKRYHNSYGEVIKTTPLVSIPTADTEPIKHGHWIEHHEPFSWMGYTTWTCSECDYEVGYEKDIKNITNYCPNCGAIMDEVEE